MARAGQPRPHRARGRLPADRPRQPASVRHAAVRDRARRRRRRRRCSATCAAPGATARGAGLGARRRARAARRRPRRSALLRARAPGRGQNGMSSSMLSKPVDDFARRLLRGAAARGAGASAPAPALRVAAELAAAVVGAAAHAFAAAEHLHLLGDDLGGVLLDAVLVVPLARLQAPLDVDRAALLQVLAGDLGQAVVEDDAVPFGLLVSCRRESCSSSCAWWPR